MRNLANKCETYHLIRKLFHLQVEYNWNFTATVKALFTGQWIHKFKHLKGSKGVDEGSKKGWTECPIHVKILFSKLKINLLCCMFSVI